MVLDPNEKKRRQEERRQQKYDNTHKEVNGIIYKQCNHHHEFYPEENEWLPCTDEYFYVNKMNGIDGLNTYCKKCTYEKATQWRLNNVERARETCRRNSYKEGVRAYHRKNSKKRQESGAMLEWQQNNKDKLKQYNKRAQNKLHTISKEEWEECKKYFDYKCAYCGFPLEDHYIKYRQEIRKSDFHKEHVQHDGAKDLSNCVPAC